jgi:hypothetical protein
VIVAITALLTRSLRSDTRALRGHGLRLLLGVVVLLLLSTTVSVSWARAAAGHDLIQIISWTSFAFITLAGVSYFCSAITEEKEEGTLGLMRMAGLDPIAILLGKSTTRLYDALLLCSTMLPFAMLAVTLGGVSLGQVLAAATALAAYVFLLANLGLLCSVVMKTSQGAGSVMTALLGVLLVGPLVGMPMLLAGGGWAAPGQILVAIGQASVANRLYEVLMTGYASGAFGLQVWLDLGIGTGCFLLAWLLFDRFAHTVAETAPASLVLRRRSRLNLFGLPRPRPGLAALAWKDFNFVCGGRLMFAIKSALVLAVATFVYYLARESYEPWQNTGDALMVIGTVWLISETGMHLSRLYAIEVQAQTLDAVATLPYDTGAVALAKLRALPPALAPALGTIVLGAALAPSIAGWVAKSVLDVPLVWLFSAAYVLFFWHACAYMSLVVKRGAFAVGIGMGILAYLGFIIIAVVCDALLGPRVRGEWLMLPATILLAIPTAVMHVRLPSRLRAKAAA